MRYKIKTPLKYMAKSSIGAWIIVGGILTYVLGEIAEEPILNISGLIMSCYGGYEMIKNTVLSVKSNLKNKLEDRVIEKRSL